MPEKSRVDKRHAPDLAKQLYIGVIIGFFVFLGTIAANFLWWYMLQRPEKVMITGFGYLIGFIVLGFFLATQAMKILKE